MRFAAEPLARHQPQMAREHDGPGLDPRLLHENCRVQVDGLSWSTAFAPMVELGSFVSWQGFNILMSLSGMASAVFIIMTVREQGL